MRSLVATIAAVVGIISLLTLALVPGAARLGLLSPLGAFTIFGGTLFFGMLLSLILGVIGLIRTRARTGLAGRQRAWLGTLAGLGMLGLIATFALVLPRSPIHDVTTNIADPPEFSDAVRTLADRRNGIDYPDGSAIRHSGMMQPIAALFPDRSKVAKAWFETARENDASRYKVNVAAVRALLANIGELISVHEAKQAADSQDWGYAGDIGHAQQLLTEVDRFLTDDR